MPQHNSTGSVNNLPAQTTAFIGRSDVLSDMVDLLIDPTCRLLTLVGPGGMGKTRLALQTGTALTTHFTDGVYFASLQDIASVEYVVSSIADALHLPLAGQDPPVNQLLNYLQHKTLLLILDNFEQLLGQGGGDLVDEILSLAPGVKMLITSREALNLQEEWLYPVRGLSFPDASGPEPVKPLEFEAVQLFTERARRLRRDFSPTEEQAGLIRICQLVEGMPLALELAASWTKTLRCETIAAEIAQHLDFLNSPMRNIPERQRSMQAVFDHSWQRLSEPEQNIFKRLSVFRGGFGRDAAEQVAGASLTTLSALVDKSLVRWEPSGRYYMHELLRQYGAAQLQSSDTVTISTKNAHSAYFAEFLHQRADAVIGRRQLRALQEIANELENVRAAWLWAVEQARLDDIQAAAFTLYQFCDAQGRFLEAANLHETAVKALEDLPTSNQRDENLAFLYVFLSWDFIRLGLLDKAKHAAEHSQELFRQLEITPTGFGNDPRLPLALLAHILGDYDQAVRLALEASQVHRQGADPYNLQIALYVLANAAFAQGNYEQAQAYANEAYTLCQQTHHRWFAAYILSELGNIARALGDVAAARQHYEAGYQIRQEFNDPEGLASILNQLGELACLQADYAQAQSLFQQGLALYRNVSDRGGLARSLNGLGVAACRLGQYQAAAQYFQQSLEITTQMNFVSLTLTIVIGAAELLGQAGQPALSVAGLTLVLHHSAADSEAKKSARQLLTRYQPKLAADNQAYAIKQDDSELLETVVAGIQPQLHRIASQAIWAEAAAPPPPAPLQPAGSSALLEPLSSRELEVLNGIASGLRNKEIAAELHVSISTVKTHINHIYRKLNVTSRVQAVEQAKTLKLL